MAVLSQSINQAILPLVCLFYFWVQALFVVVQAESVEEFVQEEADQDRRGTVHDEVSEYGVAMRPPPLTGHEVHGADHSDGQGQVTQSNPCHPLVVCARPNVDVRQTGDVHETISYSAHHRTCVEVCAGETIELSEVLSQGESLARRLTSVCDEHDSTDEKENTTEGQQVVVQPDDALGNVFAKDEDRGTDESCGDCQQGSAYEIYGIEFIPDRPSSFMQIKRMEDVRQVDPAVVVGQCHWNFSGDLNIKRALSQISLFVSPKSSGM